MPLVRRVISAEGTSRLRDAIEIPGTQGDTLYFNGTLWVPLPAGTSGQVLTTRGPDNNPVWNPAIDLTGQVQGSVTFFDGSAWVVLTPGSAGQHLQSQGAGADPIWALAAQLIANNFVTVAGPVATTSASLVDITGATFSITVSANSRIYAIVTFEAVTSGGGSNATGGWAININGSDGTEVQRFLSGTNDQGIGAASSRSAVLGAGAYTVTGRHRRVAGAKTLNSQNVSLFAIGLPE